MRSASEPTLLTPSNDEFDFATLRKGARKEETFWLVNPTSSAVEVASIKTSCDCFFVTLNSTVIEPGAKVSGVAKVDLSDDPAFVGSLLLEAKGLAKNGSMPAFVIFVRVKVGDFDAGE